MLENLNFFGVAYGLSGKNLQARIDEVLTEFHLRGSENKNAGDLPGNYKIPRRTHKRYRPARKARFLATY